MKLKLKSCGLLLVILLILLTVLSCEGDVDDTMNPTTVRILVGLQLIASPDVTTVPELYSVNFTVRGLFNDESEEVLDDEEIISSIEWSSSSSEDIKMIEFSDDPGKISWKGAGNVTLTAEYKASTKSGKQSLFAEKEMIITDPVVTTVVVGPADNYSLGCKLSTLDSDLLSEGCLMQFSAIASYDNDTTADITDDENIEWHSTEEDLANYIDRLTEIADFESMEWKTSIVNFLAENKLESKKGLVLGVNPGDFKAVATFEGTEYESTTVNIIPPTLKSISLSIDDDSIDYVEKLEEDQYSVIQNTTITFKAVGTYENNISENVTKMVEWSSSGTTKMEIEKRTGLAVAHNPTDEGVSITASYSGVSQVVTMIVTDEVIENIEYFPTTQNLDCSYNTSLDFKIEGIYNNGGVLIDDSTKSERHQQLNLNANWQSSDETVVIIDSVNMETDLANSGYITVKSLEKTGIAEISAYNTELNSTITWTLEVNNDAQIPISITVDPSDTSILAGIPIQYSATGINNNNTSSVLTSDKVIWATHPTDCQINTLTKPCITENGLVETYVDLAITATSKQDTNIEDTTQLTVMETELVSIAVIPGDYSIFEGSSLQFSAIGLFNNNTTRALDANTVQWSLSGSGATKANMGSSSGILTAVGATTDMTIIATSLSYAGEGYNTSAGIIGSTTLTIDSVPTVEFSTVSQTQSESIESGINIDINANKAPANGKDITIAYTVKGTTTQSDHALRSGIITIPAGSLTTAITFEINNDMLDEDNETVVIELDSNSFINASPGTNLIHTVTINDDDVPPTAGFIASTQTVNENSSTASISVQLSVTSGRNANVSYSISGSSDSNDHDLLDGSITIPAGSTSADIEFNIINDSQKESSENLIVTINSSSTALAGSANTHEVTIEDNDPLAITATPATSVTLNSSYTGFTPAVNVNGTLIFTITNCPGWVTFDENTGSVSGTPITLGSHYGIYICVEDSQDNETACLPPFNIEVTP